MVIQYMNWIIQHMASQSQEPTLRKQRAWWSDMKKWHSSTTLSSTNLRPLVVLSKIQLSAINSISHLHERGLVKTKVSRIYKWNVVSLVFLDLLIITDDLAHPVEGYIHHNCRIQDLGLWWNLGQQEGCRHQ